MASMLKNLDRDSSDGSAPPGVPRLQGEGWQLADPSPEGGRPGGRRDLNDRLVSEWKALEERSLEGNAFLSPSFVLPALEFLTPRAEVLLGRVRRLDEGASRLVGLGVFERRRPSWRIPVPHLRAYLSPHTYFSGVLLDRSCAASACDALFRHLVGAGWSAVEFVNRSGAGPLAALLDESAERVGMRWVETRRFERAAFVPAQVGSGYLEAMAASKRGAGLLKSIRKLNAIAPLTLRVRWGDPGSHADGAATFLGLERMGWKGAAGTALACHPHEETFFREMVSRFSAAGSFAFVELCLADRVVASSSMMTSAGTGFTFKVGWDPEFAKRAVGMVLELEFVRHAPELFGGLDCIDGCADGSSYLDPIWPGRRVVATGYYASGLALAHGRARARLRWLTGTLRWWLSGRTATTSSARGSASSRAASRSRA